LNICRTFANLSEFVLTFTFTSGCHQQSGQQQKSPSPGSTNGRVKSLVGVWKKFVRLLRVWRTFAIWSRQEFCFVISD
jgi:hypothetical protein